MKSFLFLLLSAGMALSAPPKLVIPATVTPNGSYARLVPDTDAVAVTYIGLDGVDPFPSEELKDARRFLLPTSGLAAKSYRFVAIGASATGEQTRADFSVIVGNPLPVPPGPGPSPNPPVPPGPSVRTNPFTDDTPRIMVLWDPLGQPLTAAQVAVIYGEDSRTAMKAFAPGDGLRIWPKGQTSTDKVWASALQRLPTSYPWLMAGKGSLGFEGPLTDAAGLAATLSSLTAPKGETHAPPVMTFGLPAFATNGSASPTCKTMWVNGRWVQVCP